MSLSFDSGIDVYVGIVVIVRVMLGASDLLSYWYWWLVLLVGLLLLLVLLASC